MKRTIFVFFCFFFFANTSNGDDWEGKKILVDERDKVISACEKGILSKGYPYVKVQKYVNIRLYFCQYFQYVIRPNENHHNKSSQFK